MDSPSRLTLHAIIANDPLALGLRRWLHPIALAAAGLFLGTLYTIILPRFAGVPATVSPGDWPTFVVMLVLVPLILGWYAWQPAAIHNLYQVLLSRVTPTAGGAGRPVASLLILHRSRLGAWLALVVTVLITAALAARLMPSSGWTVGAAAVIITRLFIRFITIYTLLMFLVRQLTVTVGINRIFRRAKVKLTPLHPDRAGGLRMMGNFALGSAGLVMVVGSLLSLQYVDARLGGPPLGPEFLVEVLVYLVGGPAVFFLPLLQAHRQMQVARTSLLSEISNEFDQLYQDLKARLSRMEDPAEAMVQLEALEEFYEVAADTPVWPFSVGMLRRFSGIIALPILMPAIVDTIINLMVH